jgi:TPR repeat protein
MRFSRVAPVLFVLAAAVLPPVPAAAQGGLWDDADGPVDVNAPPPGASPDDGLDMDFVVPGESGGEGGVGAAPGGFEAAVEAYRDGRFAEACETWRGLADRGHGASQHNLGVCLDHGRGMAPDARAAAGWYWQAVEHEIPEAMNNLAKLHGEGRGVARDLHLAANLYARAAELGLADAQYNLAAAYYRGLGVAKDTGRAVALMTRAAEAGHVRAQYDLGGFLLAGVDGPPDAAAAARWYGEAVRGGDAAAAYALGVLHYRGQGVTQDHARARDLIERAANAGVVPAQNQAGVMLAKGEGGDRDPVAAYGWFSVAYAMGDAAAGRNRDRLAPYLTADQIAEARARADAFRPEPLDADPLAADAAQTD